MNKKTEALIKAEKKRLMGIFEDFQGARIEALRPMIEEAAYMRGILYELHEELETDGLTEDYQNGANQHGRKASAGLNAFNSTAKIYTALMKQLLAQLPEPQAKSRGDALDLFLAGSSSSSSKMARVKAAIEAES